MTQKRTGSGINPRLAERLRQRTELPPPEELLTALKAGDRSALSRAITLVESDLERHREQANRLVDAAGGSAGHSIRIGITGSPGVGKSSFIEALGRWLIERGHRVAVLAIDPSSPVSHGSILGDKTRMQELSRLPGAFVRPSPAGSELGGVARRTRETMLLCEAAGYDVILVETVGVGQSETTVRSLVDCFLLLLLPGAGDELQGIKRGIVEMADLVAINKADGDRLRLAKETKRAYRDSLHLFPAAASTWTPRVLLCSALEGTGLEEVWQNISDYRKMTEENGFFARQRQEQNIHWLRRTLDDRLRRLFTDDEQSREALTRYEAAVRDGSISPFSAAERLVGQFLENLKRKS